MKVEDILNEGTFNVTYYAYKDLSKSELSKVHKVLALIEKAVAKDSSLLGKYLKGEEFDYDKVGLRRDEVKQVGMLMENAELVKLPGKLKIYLKDGFYCFEGEGRLAYLNGLQVSENGTSSHFRNVVMPIDSSDVKKLSDTSYLFPVLRYKNYGQDSVLDQLVHSKFVLFLGRIRKTGKVFLELRNNLRDQVDSSRNGRYAVEFD
ncbi:hypothetical protein [Flaviaesturariibacter amylovorans]|uniref:Uncharacterized protein n=1 Tax=Flaviaesturariibacter amylovorans TaxID=1084520 RepID=A0ABP8HMT1_9BACT